jgi:hypothetical protein
MKMKTDDIDKLIERYFEGETTADEERQLRAFFASESVPDRLRSYKPLFAYFDEEIQKAHPLKLQANEAKHTNKLWQTKRRWLYIASGAAAAVLLLLTLNHVLFPTDPCYCSDNYVVINGRCYTDIHTVRAMAAEALHEVATPVDEYFPKADVNDRERHVVDDQLKDLGSMFNDNETNE